MTRGDERDESVRATGLAATPDPAFDRVAGLVRRVLGVPVALVSLVDEHRQFFPGQSGLAGDTGAVRQTPLSHSFCSLVVADGAPLAIRDARLDPRTAGSPAIAELGVVAYAGHPLTDADGRVLGSLCAIDREPRDWSPQDLATLADLTAMCSSELRLRASNTASRDALARLALLGEVTRAVVSTLDAREAAERLSRVAVPSLADWAAVGVLDEAGRFPIVTSRHRDPDLAADAEAVAGAVFGALDVDAPVRRVARTGEAEPLTDALSALLPVGVGHRDAETAAGRLSAGPGLLLPLRSRGRVMGVLALVRGAGGAPYGEAHLHDALDIGRRAGLALENAELYMRQRHLSEALQRSLLTRLPEPDHLHVVARYRPAAQEAQVGGDWYDGFLQPDGATVLVVGDVMGHDIHAAAMMGQLRSLVRGIAYDRHEPPAGVLSRVDRALPALQVETLATAVVARIEQTAAQERAGLRTLRWSNAGHPPPMVVRADGTVEALDRPGDLLLGIDPSSPRADHTTVLDPGSVVLLYTDGLVERRDSPIDHGLLRLRQALAAVAALPLDELCDELLARLLPRDADDDVALIAVRAHSEDRPRPAEAGPERVPTAGVPTSLHR